MIGASSDGSREPLVIAITGASGAAYAVRLLQLLTQTGRDIHLTISPSGAAVILQELGFQLNLDRPDLAQLCGYVSPWTRAHAIKELAQLAADSVTECVRYHRFDDYMTPIASGSFRTSAMVVCPCSGSTLSGIARAASSNLIQRAAEVHLKEQRKLILVPRETPLSVLQLENMHRLAASGAVLLPAMPGWYHGVKDLDSLVDFVVSRILDQLSVDNEVMRRWGN